MKKLLLILLLFLFPAILFPQQVSQKLKYEKIFDLAAECKNVLNWKLSGLISADRADKKLAENEATMSQLLAGEVTKPDTTEEIVVESVEYSSEAQAVVDYLGSIEDLSLEKIDIQELWKGYTPIQTSTVWRNATIRKWMDLNGVSYKLYWTKARLLEEVAKSLK